MDVKLSRLLFLTLLYLVYATKEEKFTKSPKTTKDDTKADESKNESTQTKKEIDFLTKHKTVSEPKDYFLPPIFPNHDDEDDPEIDDDSPYYDYDTKDMHYKEPPEVGKESEVANPGVPNVDDKIPLPAKDNLPIFLLEPENTYVVKSKPATLKCRAANALEVYFKCNGIKIQALNFEFVDPQTGVRIVEGEHNVTREMVEEYFGSEKFQCSCFAWTSRGHIRSQPAFVELAYIKKQFTIAPQSQLVKQYTQANFRCEPPPAAPFAQVYWLKNGAPLALDDNTQVSKEGHLVIKQASILDMANYTCVAENLAGKRVSDPALLTVFVNGGWSSWSPWSDCSCAGSQRNGRRRIRTCSSPRAMNGGQPCLGPAVQKTPDCVDCDLDLYIDSLDELADQSSDVVLGLWSQWSEWSHCDTDCLQTRRRRCLSSTTCLGKDYQVGQCPLCVRTSKSDLHNGSSYWPLLIVLSIAFLIFIVVVLLGIKYLKLKMTDTYIKSHPGSNYIGHVIKRTLTNQPDLTIHEEFQTMDSRRTQRHLSSNMSNCARNEHLYEVPQLANSYMTPLDHEVRNEMHKENTNHLACKEYTESDHSESSCFLSSNSSYGNESVVSPSLKNNISINSYSKQNSLDSSASKIFNTDGGWLNLYKSGVNLFVPEGAIDKGEELFAVEINDDEWSKPIVDEGETLLSPIIRCNPKNTRFRKSVILSFPHFASLKHSNWIFSIFQKAEDGDTKAWCKAVTLGQETPGPALFAQADHGKVFIASEFLSDFVLVGRSFSGLDAKLFKLGLFISKRTGENYNLTVQVINDTPHALNTCVENEKRLGNTLFCEPKTISFQQNCSNLCFNLRDVGDGWKVSSDQKYQELPYQQIWDWRRPLRCEFTLQQIDSANCLNLNLSVYQKQKQSNNVSFNFIINDLNSNLLKRYSSELCPVNILENPFHFSSLSKKEGIYDFVYKSGNYLHRNSLSVDNNYRCNALSKSDRVILCKLLDQQTSAGNDWRLLAEKLKIDSYYYYFSNTCSPTDNILNLWLCRNNNVNMLLNLARIFREMLRIDCAIVVERRCYPN